MDGTLKTLIDEGKSLTFQTNSYTTHGEPYGRASADFRAWCVKAGEYILRNYGEHSIPYKQYGQLNLRLIEGNYSSVFYDQHNIVMGALLACQNILPTKSAIKPEPDHAIIALIKNLYFWSVLVVVCTTSFLLGGIRFDQNLIDLSEHNRALNDSIAQYKNGVEYMRNNSDSALAAIANMPYNKMKLDTAEFRLVQSTIEKGSAMLYLNKNFKVDVP